jgi:hypothetical protein
MGSYLTHYCNARAVKRRNVLDVPQITIIRHPVERLISAYHFGWLKKHKASPDFETWWDYVKSKPTTWDLHTMPTVEILEGTNPEIFRLEEIYDWWPTLERRWPFAFGFGPLGRTNMRRYEKISLPPALEDEVKEKYAEDLALWLSVGN